MLSKYTRFGWQLSKCAIFVLTDCGLCCDEKSFWLQVCQTWYRLAGDEFLWRDLVYCHWSIDRSIPRSSCCGSWHEEYKRLYDQSPVVESEVISSHTDQVLHVSFSHDGRLFATTSKDGFIKVSCTELWFIQLLDPVYYRMMLRGALYKLSFHDAEVSWSHKLEYFKNNFMTD